jgi:hypothetical protein
MLAAAGAHSASRAWGTSAVGAYERYMPLASQRLARSRTLALLVIALCASLTARTIVEPKLLLFIAAALSLSLVAPALAVAASERANSAHGAAAALISLATAVGLAVLEGRIPEPEKLLIGALCAAATGFIVGWSAAIFSPRRRGPSPVRRDLFLDAPLDAGR